MHAHPHTHTHTRMKTCFAHLILYFINLKDKDNQKLSVREHIYFSITQYSILRLSVTATTITTPHLNKVFNNLKVGLCHGLLLLFVFLVGCCSVFVVFCASCFSLKVFSFLLFLITTDVLHLPSPSLVFVSVSRASACCFLCSPPCVLDLIILTVFLNN